jgi:AGZA family xanthine/uracil permease-like MFS transporter
MVMPFSYSISKGITFGIISYVLCKVVARKTKQIPLVTWILAIVFLFDIIFEAVK